jgi:hypothetical protein
MINCSPGFIETRFTDIRLTQLYASMHASENMQISLDKFPRLSGQIIEAGNFGESEYDQRTKATWTRKRLPFSRPTIQKEVIP